MAAMTADLTADQVLNLVLDSVTGKLKMQATVDVGDIEIGAVELKDGAADTRAKIAALNALVAGDNGLGVADPIVAAILGATNAAAVAGDADASLNARLRYLNKVLADVYDGTNNALRIRFKAGSTPTYKAASGQISAVACRLHGFSLFETAGGAGDPAAKAYLRNSADNSGAIVAVVTFAPNESTNVYFGDRGIACDTGLYLDVITGAIAGDVFSGPA